jgi:hypothetical protein
MRNDLERKIERKENNLKITDEELIKQAAFLGLSAGIVVAGAFGTIHFGQAFYEALTSDVPMTFGSYTFSQLKGSGAFISGLVTIGGSYGVFANGKNVAESVIDHIDTKKDIKVLKLEQKRQEQQENDYR